MKYPTLLLFICTSYLCGQAQIETIDAYLTGTRITYYTGECGNAIPEAEDKISFCDAAGNLGVVEASTGLNSDVVNRMVDNHHNDDLVFITSKGISIQHEDGTWLNLPNRAVPSETADPGSSSTAIQDAVRMPDGRIAFLGAGFGRQITFLDPTTKELSSVQLVSGTTYHYPRAICYDPDRDLLWILAIGSGENYLYSYDGTSMSVGTSVGAAPGVSLGQADLWNYANDMLFLGHTNGLYRIDIEAGLSQTLYDNTNTGLLPYDRVRDMEVANDSTLWISLQQDSPLAGGLVYFDWVNETYSLYQYQQPGSPDYDLTLGTLCEDPSGEVWVVADSYSGVLRLNPVDSSWTSLSQADLENEGVDYIYNPGFLHLQGSTVYFCTRTNSTGATEEVEIFFNESGQWSTISDNAEGNLSHQIISADYGRLLSHPDGGIWWFGAFGDEFLYMSDQTGFAFEYGTGYLAPDQVSIDPEGLISMRLGSEFGSYDGAMFTPYEEFESGYNFTASSNAGESTWAYRSASGNQALVKYVAGAITDSHVFSGGELDGYYDFAALSDGQLAFVRNLGSDLVAKVYDPQSETLQELSPMEPQGIIREIIAAEDGAFWIICDQGLVYLSSASAAPLYLTEDNTVMQYLTGSTSIYDAVLDTDMNLHVIQGSGVIYTFAPPYDDLQADVIQFSGDDGIMPYQNGFQQGYGIIGLDTEGDLWFGKRQQELYELRDDVTAGEYHVDISVGLAEHEASDLPFSIYPNPSADGQADIRLLSEQLPAQIEVYDSKGQLSYSGMISSPVAHLDLRTLPAGCYQIRLLNEQGVGHDQLLIGN